MSAVVLPQGLVLKNNAYLSSNECVNKLKLKIPTITSFILTLFVVQCSLLGELNWQHKISWQTRQYSGRRWNFAYFSRAPCVSGYLQIIFTWTLQFLSWDGELIALIWISLPLYFVYFNFPFPCVVCFHTTLRLPPFMTFYTLVAFPWHYTHWSRSEQNDQGVYVMATSWKGRQGRQSYKGIKWLRSHLSFFLP